MKKCGTCGSTKFETVVLEEFHDDLMGVPVVVENAVKEERCNACGEVRGNLIPNLEGLIAAVAIARSRYPRKLSGEEIRFLRKALNWKAKELAQKLDVTPEQVSRWENNRIPISPTVERYLRLVVCNLLSTKAPKIHYDPEEIVTMKINPMRPANTEFRMVFWQRDRKGGVVNKSHDDENWLLREQKKAA